MVPDSSRTANDRAIYLRVCFHWSCNRNLPPRSWQKMSTPEVPVKPGTTRRVVSLLPQPCGCTPSAGVACAIFPAPLQRQQARRLIHHQDVLILIEDNEPLQREPARETACFLWRRHYPCLRAQGSAVCILRVAAPLLFHDGRSGPSECNKGDRTDITRPGQIDRSAF